MSPLSHRSRKEPCLARACPGSPALRSGDAAGQGRGWVGTAGAVPAALACGELAGEPGEAARGYEQQFCFVPFARGRAELPGTPRLAAEPRPCGVLARPTGPGAALRGEGML